MRVSFWSRLKGVGSSLSQRAQPRLALTVRKPKLSAIMAGFFVCLSIPILIFILFYNYLSLSEI
ncbi:hypothetical protein [Bradyrhizobium sp. Ash2021]|uniref:hypothetical protein n=1 Tax=Bradyrhizobium sp. Ash2021 TaxID=2954771 RepID=UPI002815713F|nr:hypothetical protein [Bradyrhizobium sp. Ash2021]WMT79709.1 hypothetical protein NL528_45755 [Bradyrhizobium sp. Ash2021]